MDSEIAELDRLFTFGLSHCKGKPIFELELMCGECNGDLDKMFESMIKNIPIRITRKIAIFGLLLDDAEESLRNRCTMIAYKSSRDIVVIGVFRKTIGDIIYYCNHCILNKYVSTYLREEESGLSHYVFKTRSGDNTTAEMTVDQLPSFIGDFCDTHFNSRNWEKIDGMTNSVKHKMSMQRGFNLQEQKSGGEGSTKKDMCVNDRIKSITSNDKKLVWELKKRIRDGEIELFNYLLKMECDAYACQAIAELYNGEVKEMHNFEKAIEYYKKAGDMFKEISDKDYTNCMNQIASIYCDKSYPGVDYKEALKWFYLGKYATSKSYYQHSFCSYHSGNYGDSFTSAVRSIELRERKGYFSLGMIFSDEKINDKVDYLETNFQLAARCFEESLKTKSHRQKSMIQLAALLVDGKITVYDSPAAISALVYLSKAKRGFWAIELGKAYYFGKYGLAKDFEKADALFSENLEVMYHKISAAVLFSELILRGLSKMEKKFVKDLIDAAEENNPDMAQILVCKGVYLYHGLGYNTDRNSAYEYFSKCLSICSKDPVAQSYIAMLKMDGFDVVQDVQGNVDYLIELSDGDGYHGNKALTYNLIAECYYCGKGTDVDYEKALDYYKKASESQITRIFCIFSRMMDCMEKLSINDKKMYYDIALMSKHSSDSVAEEIAGDLLMTDDELLAMEYYCESYKNGNLSAKGKYQRLLNKYPNGINKDDTIVKKKINAVRNLKTTMDSKFGVNNVSSQRCKRMIALLSNNLSIEELDDDEKAVIEAYRTLPQGN